jgi:hypothetical protein
VHEARRRAAREGRLPAAVPDVVVTCGREACRDGDGIEKFVERFRWDRSQGRWVATAQTAEVHLRPDQTPTKDTVGWDGPAPERSRWDLRCPSCGHHVPGRDNKAQTAFELLRRQAEGEGRGGDTIHATLSLLEGMFSRLRDPG